jgi:hypothetical protein
MALLRSALAARPDSAALLFQLSESLASIGDHAASARAFAQAFRLTPTVRPRLDADAAKPPADRARKLRDDAKQLLAHGVAYAPVIAALAIGESLLGHAAKAARLVDYQSFFRCEAILPAGGAGDAAFRAGLAHELTAQAVHRKQDKGRAGAGRYTYGVLDAPSPACRLLAAALRRQVERYIAALPPSSSHPFVTSRPARYALRGWSVAAAGDDHFAPHIHPQAWLSGVYYLAEPGISRDDGAMRGWLRAGPPAQFGVSTEQGWAERSIEPVPGRLVLMPGYFYHETLPTLCDEVRVCVAFNVVPEELDA